MLPIPRFKYAFPTTPRGRRTELLGVIRPVKIAKGFFLRLAWRATVRFIRSLPADLDGDASDDFKDAVKALGGLCGIIKRHAPEAIAAEAAAADHYLDDLHAHLGEAKG